MIFTLPILNFHIRSFHPEKDFGWSGLYFEGDNRGFSNKPSGKGTVTSRIWHHFRINTKENEIALKKTASDNSKAPWSDKYKKYDGALAPKDLLMPLHVNRKSNSIHFKLLGYYGGENHAMPGSSTLQKKIGASYVPTLDVHYKLRMDIDEINKHVDIVLEVYGDGFPNCEAFVIDSKGQSVFLGTHVRRGAAPISLAMNLKAPMIVCAIRLPLNTDGSFTGIIGNEWARVKNKKSEMAYTSTNEWNQEFALKNPNANHCMALEHWSLKGCF